MKKRLQQVAAIAVVIVSLVTVWAETEAGEHDRMQRAHGGMMHGDRDFDRIVEHMSRRLELDDSQELTIRNIVDAAKPEAEALREKVRENREATHSLDIMDADYDVKLQNLASQNGELVTQMTLLRGRVMAEVGAELTDEQRAKLAKARDRRRERFRHHRGACGR